MSPKEQLREIYFEEKERLETLQHLSQTCITMIKNPSFRDYVDVLAKKYVEILDEKEYIRIELEAINNELNIEKGEENE
jgi:hypothetical protein